MIIDLIEQVAKEVCKWCRKGISLDEGFHEDSCGGFHKCTARRDQMARVLERQWIACSERMPEKNDEYIVIDDGEAFSETADFRDGQWFTVREYGQYSEPRELYNVTHWQPLPAPPASAQERE